MTDITELLAKLENTATVDAGYLKGIYYVIEPELMAQALDIIRAAAVPKNGVAEGEIPYSVIVELFNSTLSQYLPKALTKMPPMRRRMLAQRWQEDKDRRSITWWADYWKRVSKSDFLCGRSPPRPGHENWIPNIDWFLKPSNMAKVLEGNYDPRGPRMDVENVGRFR